MFSLVNFNSMMSKQNIDGDEEEEKRVQCLVCVRRETRPPDHTWEVEHLLLHICKSSLFPVQGDSVSLSGRFFSLSLSRVVLLAGAKQSTHNRTVFRHTIANVILHTCRVAIDRLMAQGSFLVHIVVFQTSAASIVFLLDTCARARTHDFSLWLAHLVDISKFKI